MVFDDRLVRGLFLVLALGSITMASASDWEPISTSADSYSSVDVQSLVRKGNVVTGWTKRTYDNPVPYTKDTSGTVTYQIVVSHEDWNCLERSGRGLSMTYFGDLEEQTVISNFHFPATELREAVVPDSVGETILNYVCKVTAPKKQLQRSKKASTPTAGNV